MLCRFGAGDTDKGKKLLKEIEKLNEALEPMMDEYEEQIEQERARNPTGWDAENIVLEKPIETGAKLGLGFILMSAGVTIASVFTGMLLGE